MSPRYRWVISLVSVCVVMAALGFGRFGYTLILPPMQTHLSLTNPQVGDLAAANMTGYLLLSVLGGFLASRFGARGVISISLFVVAASLGLTGLAEGQREALIGRFLTGIGSGGANVPIMGLLVAWYRPERRGLAAGIAVSGSSFGLLVTGIVIPYLINRFGADGWRASWFALSAGAGVIAILATALLRNRPDAPSAAAGDVSGEGGPDFRHLLRSRSVWLLSGIYVTFGFSYVIYATFFARGLISAGFTETGAGAIWSGIGAASIASGFIWGLISDRIGRRLTLGMIYLIQASSFLIFGLCLLTDGIRFGFYVSAALFALTAWSIPAVMSAAAGDLMGARLASAAFGVITLFFGVGQIAGPFVGGRLAEAYGGFGPSFVLAAAVAAAGAVLSFVLIPTRLQGTSDERGSSSTVR